MTCFFQTSIPPFLTFHSLSRVLSISIVTLTLGACSWFGGDDPEADGALILSPLEVPPDLVRPQGDPRLARPTLPAVKKYTAADNNKLAAAPSVDCRCNELPSIGERVLPAGKGVQRMREGQRRWLIVQAEPEQVWPLVRAFLEMRGYRVARNEPAIGLLETDWKALFADEEHATSENGEANWRERLRILIEPAEQAGRTNIFVTQRHSQRVSEQWELRPADEDRAVEMLNRLANYLVAKDVQDAVSLESLNASLASYDDNTVLQLETTFDKAWRRTILALESLGFTIEDRDRANRIFHISNELPSGLTEDDVAFGRPGNKVTVKEEYWLHLQESDKYINLSVRTKEGKVEDSQVTRQVLNLLVGQFQ